MLMLILIANRVLTGNNNDISISLSIRRTQGFDVLMFMLMSWLSSLAHKLLMLMLMLMLALVPFHQERYYL